MKTLFCILFFFSTACQLWGQERTDWNKIEADRLARLAAKTAVLKVLTSFTSTGGNQYWLYDIENDLPVYFSYRNAISQQTIGANRVKGGGVTGFNLSGSGVSIGVWDQPVNINHVEFAGRITSVDGDPYVSGANHGTHVTGTVASSGVNSLAQGFSHAAIIRSYSSENDLAEIDAAATTVNNTIYVSNHSYGPYYGWVYNRTAAAWQWTAGSAFKDWHHGAYTSLTKDIDQLCWENPRYLMVRAVGNETGNGIASGSHLHSDGNTYTDTHKIDGGSNQFENIPADCVSKNALIIGSVADIPAGYSNPADVVISAFSCRGPTDDGRIKPDLVANGETVFSSEGTTNTSYANRTGTSMAAPSATGAIGLLQEQWNRYNASPMYSHTMKALLIHTADEAGLFPGPDYTFGWGLINVDRAARLIHQSEGSGCNQIFENNIGNAGTYSINVYSNGTTPLKVTLCWTDVPPQNVNTGVLNPATSYLTDNLNLTVESNGQTFYPWVLNKNQPANAATKGINNIDNTEQVLINAPAPGNYTIRVAAPASVNNGSLPYCVIISGQSPLFVNAVFNNVTMNAVYTGQNSVTVTGNSQVGTINPAQIKAGNFIDLKAGFTAGTGTNFKAYPINSNGCFLD